MVLETFYGDASNKGLKYTPKQGDVKEDVETAMVLMIPTGLVECMLTTPYTPWGLHTRLASLITETKAPQTPSALEPCLGWCLKAC